MYTPSAPSGALRLWQRNEIVPPYHSQIKNLGSSTLLQKRCNHPRVASKDEYRLLSFDELDPEAQSCIPNSRDGTCKKYQLEKY